MRSYAVAQINRLARHLVSLRPQPHRHIHLVRGRRVEQWIKLVDAAAHAVEAATGGSVLADRLPAADRHVAGGGGVLRQGGSVMPTVAADTPDIRVENYGSVVLLRPATAAGRAWLEENCDRSGYQPFAGGTVLCEPRYVEDIVAGARGAGLEVR